jgi:hypothetical protein
MHERVLPTGKVVRVAQQSSTCMYACHALTSMNHATGSKMSVSVSKWMKSASLSRLCHVTHEVTHDRLQSYTCARTPLRCTRWRTPCMGRVHLGQCGSRPLQGKRGPSHWCVRGRSGPGELSPSHSPGSTRRSRPCRCTQLQVGRAWDRPV